MLNSAIGAYYHLRIVVSMYFDEAHRRDAHRIAKLQPAHHRDAGDCGSLHDCAGRAAPPLWTNLGRTGVMGTAGTAVRESTIDRGAGRCARLFHRRVPGA